MRLCRNFILMEDWLPGQIVVPLVLCIGPGPMKSNPLYQSRRLWFDYTVIDIRGEEGAGLLASGDIEDNMPAMLTDAVNKKSVIMIIGQCSRSAIPLAKKRAGNKESGRC